MRTVTKHSDQSVRARYFIGGAAVGETITIGFGVKAEIRKQYATGSKVGIELVIEDLIIEVKSDDIDQTCSLFSYGDLFYNIRGDGSQKADGGTYLWYVVEVTDPETSPCRNNPVQRDPGMRLD